MKYSNFKKNFKANETLVSTICVLCRSTVTVLLWEFVLNLRGNLPQSMINKAGWGIETSREALRTISNAACLLNHCTYSQACEVMRINFDSCADKKIESRAVEKTKFCTVNKTTSCAKKKTESWAMNKLNPEQWTNWILSSEQTTSCAKKKTESCTVREKKLIPAQRKRLNLEQRKKTESRAEEKTESCTVRKKLNPVQRKRMNPEQRKKTESCTVWTKLNPVQTEILSISTLQSTVLSYSNVKNCFLC